jgi:hypothetical protein
MRAWLPLLLLLASPCCAAAEDEDGIRRCIGAGGVSIYTDRACEELDAVDRLPPPPPDLPQASADDAGFTRRGCARRADALLFELRRAIESGNVNQIAGLYHWPGVGQRAARGIMGRLEALADRPLAAVELVYWAREPEPVSEFVADGDSTPAPVDEPIGVRIDQAMPGEVTPSFSVYLDLVQHVECWWVRF